MDSCKSFLIRDLLGDLINRQNDNGNSYFIVYYISCFKLVPESDVAH